MKFSSNDFFRKCHKILTDLVTFTEEVLNEKLYFLRSAFFCPIDFLQSSLNNATSSILSKLLTSNFIFIFKDKIDNIFVFHDKRQR